MTDPKAKYPGDLRQPLNEFLVGMMEKHLAHVHFNVGPDQEFAVHITVIRASKNQKLVEAVEKIMQEA